MKFTVESIGTQISSNMRLGQLADLKRIPNSVFLTPLLLLYSKGGSVTHLTREVLEIVADISKQALQMPLANSAQCYKGVVNYHKGISSFVGLPECMSYCTVQDPAEVTKVGYNDKSSVTIWTHTGRKQLTPDKYMDMVEAFQPDMYHVLCDGDTNIESTQKRGQKAVDVSASMFLACAERHFKSQFLRNSSLLAVLEGGYNIKARRQSAQMFVQHPLVRGFVIDGLHNNGAPVEDMSYETIQPVITETLKYLPEGKLRVIHGSWRPDVVLELVNAGVDVFDSSLVYLATERGCALSFTYKATNKKCNGKVEVNGHPCGNASIKEIKNAGKTVQTSVDSNSNDYQINLNDKRYFDDLTPVLPTCTCHTCTTHTRSYIHHLLNTKEMLASVLLMSHNIHHYLQFFDAIRESGKKGQLLTIDPPLS